MKEILKSTLRDTRRLSMKQLPILQLKKFGYGMDYLADIMKTEK